jgi:hypothetical protein
VRVQVDEPGEQPLAARVDDAHPLAPDELLGRVAPGARDRAALDDHVDHGVERAGGIDRANVAQDENVAHGTQL